MFSTIALLHLNLIRNDEVQREPNERYSPPPSARGAFPESLRMLYLAPPRLDANVAEDVRCDPTSIAQQESVSLKQRLRGR